ncbi:MAG: gamma-glutamyltransferase [Bacteroidetes bacterium]|nr:gamma-glutamyltransferase [Bacteroidota bacterium]
MKQLSFQIICILCILFSSCQRKASKKVYDIQKTAIAHEVMAVSAHPMATKVGVEILKKGGNAVDAAIAVQFALAVTYPAAGNIGGGGFMVIRLKDGKTAALDFREKAPLTASKDMYLDSLGNALKNKSRYGHLAAGVPGTVDGMIKAHQKFGGIKDFSTLVKPAIRLAKTGFRLTEKQAGGLNRSKENFLKYCTSKPVFVKDTEWKEGDLLVQKDLAHTLQLISKKGRAGFYEGEVADKIVQEMQAGAGVITHEDLRAYDAKWREPVVSSYKQFTLIGMPPPSSGGIALAQLLKIVEPYPLKDWGFQSTKTVHLITEAERRVYADRAAYLGDSDFFPVPMDTLMASSYLRHQMESFEENAASSSEEIQSGTFVLKGESEETTHFSIVDAEGNAVSVTTTINSGYGNKVVVSGAGFLLNNEMDDFSIKPGVPNQFGLVGSEANKIEAEKRMLSSMTPTIVLNNDQLFMIVGSPGGSTIITSVFQTFLNVVEFDMSMSEAVRAKRFHHQWMPDKMFYEKEAFSPEIKAQLESMGHTLTERGPIGRVDAILVLPNGQLEGGADPRGDDHTEGY